MGGKLLQIASPEVIYDDPAHIEVARFIGQPRINLLPGKKDAHGIVQVGALRLSSSVAPAGAANVTLGIRPEFVQLRAEGQGALAARVERLEFLGSEVIVFARLAAIGETVLAKVSPAEARGLVAGRAIGLNMDPSRIMLFAEDGHRLLSAPVSATLREAAHG
jgi:multiple sugar transport system ATP-binding protein